MPDTNSALVIALSADIRSLRKEMQNAVGISGKAARDIERRNKQMSDTLNSQMAGIGKRMLAPVSGISGLLGGALAGFGVSRMITDLGRLADQVEKQKTAWGVSGETVQAWSLIAKQAGVEGDALASSIGKFNKNLGEIRAGGTNDLSKVLSALKVSTSGKTDDVLYRYIDGLAGIKDESIRARAAQAGFGKGQQELAAFVAQGSAAIKGQTAEIIRNGGVISDEMLTKIKAAGDKFEYFKSIVTATVGAPLVTGLAEGFEKITGDLSSPQFQTSIKQFGETIGQLSAFVATHGTMMLAIAAALATPGPPLLKGIVGLGTAAIAGRASETQLAQGKVAAIKAEIATPYTQQTEFYVGPGGQMIPRGAGEAPDARMARLKRELADAEAKVAQLSANPAPAPSAGPPPSGKHNLSGVFGEDEANKARAAIAEANVGAATAFATLTAASDENRVAMLKGTAAYFDAVMKQIEDEKAARIAVAGVEETKALEHLKTLKLSGAQQKEIADAIRTRYDAERKVAGLQAERATFENGPGGFMKSAGMMADDQVRQYQGMIDVIGLMNGELARVQFLQEALNNAREHGITLTKEQRQEIEREADRVGKVAQAFADTNEKQDRQRELAVSVRNGFERIGLSALRSADSVGEAIKSMIQDMLMLAAKQKLIAPMSNWLFGKGDSLGGVVGGGIQSVLDAIPGFAAGTESAPGGLSIVGEKGPELLNLPKGAQVIPRAPDMASIRRAPASISFNSRLSIDLSGANGDAAIEAAALRGAQNGHAAAVQQIYREFPKLVAIAIRDHG